MNIAIAQGTISGETVQTVNARELHAFLEVGKFFANWIKDRIEQYGFEEKLDYVVIAETGKNSSGGRPSRDYHISLDMAKELSMVERNEKGKQARQYFIECEKRAKAAPVLDLNNPAQLRGLLSNYAERTEIAESRAQQLQIENDGLSEDAHALARVAKADGSFCITDAAKALQIRPKDLFSWLRSNGWIYRRPGAGHDLGYQGKTTSGLLEHKVTTVLRADGSEKITEQVRVTPKGLTKLAKLIPGVAKDTAA